MRVSCRLFGLLLLPLVLALPSARADVGVVLADPTTIGVSTWTHAGHSLVYLSGVCADTPTHARLCGPGEQGSIVTMYPDFHENKPYAWNLSPLSLYLEGSLVPGNRLLYASHHVKEALEVHGRGTFLATVCAGNTCPEQPHSYWRDLVGATIDRDIFFYVVHSTRAQDQAAVDLLNNTANINQYRTLTHNCSDFTRVLVDTIFPHSVHRDFLNDLAMMSPKAAAHSFTRWAVKRPELGFYTMHFAQQPGDMPRSGLARSGTEDGIHMKKYLIPAALIGDHEVAGSFFIAYYFTGRFGLYKEYALHPNPAIVALDQDARDARQQGHKAEAIALRSSAQEARAAILGEADQWAHYREAFLPIADSTEAQDLRNEALTPAQPPVVTGASSVANAVPDRSQAAGSAIGRTSASPDSGSLEPSSKVSDAPSYTQASQPSDKPGKKKNKKNKVLFPTAFAEASVTVDAEGLPWLHIADADGVTRQVGLSSANLLAPSSDPRLAFSLMLGRVSYALLAKDHFRESMPEFQKDWSLLERAQARLAAAAVPASLAAAN